MAEIKQQIGSAVRAARKARGMSQQEVADAIGTTLETVSKCERGASAPSLEVFLSMVRVLGLDVPDLVANASNAEAVSPNRARLQAEIAGTARRLTDAELQLYAEFGKLLRGWTGKGAA